MPVTKSTFPQSPQLTLYTLTNRTGQLVVKILDYGATIVNLLFADKTGIQRDLVLGFDDFKGYSSGYEVNPYIGCAVGRIANRVGNSTFNLNNKTYQLYPNNGPNSMHGGHQGFNNRIWSLVAEDLYSITLQYVSPDNEEGYPGTLRSLLKFTVTDLNELRTEFSANLDADQSGGGDLKTVVNLTNHSYFNLNGAFSSKASQVLDHEILMQAKYYQESDNWLVPTGTLAPVAGTLLDFTKTPRTIGSRAFQLPKTNQNPHGYDLCYVLDDNPDNYRIDPEEVRKALEIYAPLTGIKLTLLTTEPAFQFYTGQSFPEGSKPKKSQTTDPSVKLGSYAGLCIEAQRFVDAPNKPNWARQVVLSGGEQQYKQTTVYKFEVTDGI